jgi:hypothetical protein
VLGFHCPWSVFKTAEAGVGVLASAIGYGAKMVAEVMINASPQNWLINSECGAGFDRAAVLDQDLRQHACDGRTDFKSDVVGINLAAHQGDGISGALEPSSDRQGVTTTRLFEGLRARVAER